VGSTGPASTGPFSLSARPNSFAAWQKKFPIAPIDTNALPGSRSGESICNQRLKAKVHSLLLTNGYRARRCSSVSHQRATGPGPKANGERTGATTRLPRLGNGRPAAHLKLTRKGVNYSRRSEIFWLASLHRHQPLRLLFESLRPFDARGVLRLPLTSPRLLPFPATAPVSRNSQLGRA
jgi:hypothetical protein